jgi:hypothetical protein
METIRFIQHEGNKLGKQHQQDHQHKRHNALPPPSNNHQA